MDFVDLGFHLKELDGLKSAIEETRLAVKETEPKKISVKENK